MTEQTSASRGYNLTMNVESVTESTMANGNTMLRAKVQAKLRGEMRPRTLIAQGKAAEAVREVLVEGAEGAKIRCLIDHVTNDDGERGGEFLVAIGLPLPPKEAA